MKGTGNWWIDFWINFFTPSKKPTIIDILFVIAIIILLAFTYFLINLIQSQ